VLIDVDVDVDVDVDINVYQVRGEEASSSKLISNLP
jgi:hypothetical protein